MERFTARQKEIINTAIELIAEHGIQVLTIKNLSQRIGIAESAIYRHFNSKTDILFGILSIFVESKEEMAKTLRRSDLRPIEKLKQMLIGRFEYFSRNRAIATVIFSEELFRNDQKLSELIYETMTSVQNTVISVIEEGQKAGEIRDDVSAKHLGYMITGAIRLIVMHWRYSGFKTDLIEEGKKFWESVKAMITKEEC